MTHTPEPVAFTPDWPAPDAKFLRPEIPPAPELPIDDVFGPRFAAWAREAAEAKGAPPDYAVFSVVSVISSVIGNAGGCHRGAAGPNRR